MPNIKQNVKTVTEERIAAFKKCQIAVSNCQQLYFLDDTTTPILQTDASDYGVGVALTEVHDELCLS